MSGRNGYEAVRDGGRGPWYVRNVATGRFFSGPGDGFGLVPSVSMSFPNRDDAEAFAAALSLGAAAVAARASDDPETTSRMFEIRDGDDVRYEGADSVADLHREMRCRSEDPDDCEIRELSASEAALKPFRINTEEYQTGSTRAGGRGLASRSWVIVAVNERDAENLWRDDSTEHFRRTVDIRLLLRDELAMLFPRDFGPEGARDVGGWIAKRGGRRGVVIPLG